MNPWKWFGLAAAFVLALWGFSWGLLWWQPTSTTGPGPFGDMFGAVNALFSGLAFAGIIVALWLQRRDLEMQRGLLQIQMEEIKLQRKELARSAAAQEELVRAMRRQSETLRVTAEANVRASLMQAYSTPITAGGGMYQDKWDHELTQLLRVLGELDPEYTP